MAAVNSPDDARSRMIHSAAALQRSTGVTGTGFADIVAHSGVSRGSIYHHFPEGRIQLAAEATVYAAEGMADTLRGILVRASDVHEALDAFVAMFSEIMEADDYHAGCAVAAAALDSRSAPRLRKAANDGFMQWQEILVEGLRATGLDDERATSLSVTVLAAVEGSIILSRASGGSAPLERVRDELHRLIDSALQTSESQS